MTKIKQRFDHLLKVMIGPEQPLKTRTKEVQTSGKASGAGYGDTRTREGRSASVSSKRERKSP